MAITFGAISYSVNMHKSSIRVKSISQECGHYNCIFGKISDNM